MTEKSAPPHAENKEIAPPLAFGAASFAAFLTILNTDDPGPNAIVAVKLFAVGLPLLVASTSILLNRPEVNGKTSGCLLVICLATAYIVNLIGVYYCFLEVSDQAALLFLISIGVSLCLTFAVRSVKAEST